ncbi:MAG: hypothetical protein LH679_19845 [Cyanobacteria bacterium CAN_BIN43]|nr:hypothetical protein [Cyanobacteria bacterium CAN_BIN43]
MPDLSLLIASLAQPRTLQEPVPFVLSSVSPSVSLSCSAVKSSSPESTVTDRIPCPEFSPVAISAAVPLSSSGSQEVATPISVLEPDLPALPTLPALPALPA